MTPCSALVAQRAPDDCLDDLLGVERRANGPGEVVENRKLIDGPLEPFVLFFQKAQRLILRWRHCLCLS